jgi:HK97 family phage major capsid protein/HK97 family phage prohead protease
MDKSQLNKELQNRKMERFDDLSVRAVDNDNRTVEIAFSSEQPYERWFGEEVLRHDAESVMLDRLERGAAVLVNHDVDDQVGVVESARIDDDSVGRAFVRFSKSTRGQEIFNDVVDGIRKSVSVGYRIHEYEIEEREGMPDLVTVTKWQPFEVSIVAVPADVSVGIGRQDSPITEELPMKDESKDQVRDEKPEVEINVKPHFDHTAELSKVRTEEKRRVDSIRQIADKFNITGLGDEGVSEGWSVEQFNERALEEVGKRNNAARSSSNHDGELDLSQREQKEFSMLRLLDAIAHPNDRTAQKRAGFELEVSAEAQRGFGSDFAARGEFIPTSLLNRDLSAGTATDGKELVATNLLAGRYIDVLRNASSVMRAGATMLPGLVGDVAIPRQTSGAASTWITAEDGDATESEAQFDQVTMSPKDLACYTEVTRRLLQQSTPGIEGIVRNDLAIAQGLGIDAAALYGTASNGQPRGIVNQASINTLDLAAANPTYAELVNMVAQVMVSNAMTGSPMWLIEANGWEALTTTPRQASGVEGNFILSNERIVAHPYIMSNQVADEDYFFGDFSQVLVGEWGGLEINVDPYTHSLKGKVRYVTFKTVDVAVRHPQCFCYANDAIV